MALNLTQECTKVVEGPAAATNEDKVGANIGPNNFSQNLAQKAAQACSADKS